MIRIVKNKILGLATVLAGMVFVGILMQSCNSETDFESLTSNENSLTPLASDEFEYFGKRVKCQDGELKWQKQLSLIINDNDRIKENDLVLKNFKYTGKIVDIKDFEQIKTNIINDAVFPVYTSPNKFDIRKRDNVSQKDLNLMLDSIISISKNIEDTKEKFSEIAFHISFEADDMGAVELEWIYRGKKLNTIAIVSDKKGIVYDNLLYFLHFVEIINAKESVLIQSPRLKSGSESSTNGSISYNDRSPTYISTNLIGTKCAEAWCSISVTGNSNNNIKSISSHIENAYYWASSGYTATAQITVTSFVTGNSGHCSYQYAVATGSSGSVTVSWNGSSYSISGGGHGKSGGAYISPSSLN
jgi:hypothetical protein